MSEGESGTPESRRDKDRRVRLLSDALVDQIAAGEVVERPASVVKELVENALDAGASRVRVEVRDGGAAFIAVTDDGYGMSPDDLRMALLRHATSKLRAQGDLERIHSFGFRGEALPSIASVSRLRIVSRERGADEGYEIRLEAGEVLRESAAGGPVGTRIEVADLFAPVPARRKFLKKPGTEWGHISDWLSRLALSLPGVHFEVQRDDRPALVWPVCTTTRDRIAQVLTGRDAEALVEVEREDATGHLHAFASPPTHHRANGEGLYLYVNGRPVRDKLLRSAVIAAYRDILPRGRYPTAVVFLTVAPEQVDVNVHPAKWEVRFAEPQAVHQLVRRAVRDAMSDRAWLSGEGGAAHEATAQSASASEAAGAASFQPAAARSARSTSTTTDWIFANEAERLGEPAPAGAGDDRVEAPMGSRPEALRSVSTADIRGERRPFRFAELNRLGQIKASYVALEGPGGLVLVDQHAAHERVLYERLRSAWLEAGVERQGLLVPVTVELQPLQLDALVEGASAVEQLGFEIEAFGEAAVVVRAVPALLGDRDPEGLVRELAEELEKGSVAGSDPGVDTAEGQGERIRLLAAVDRVFATLACHSARRFGDRLDAPEQEAILRGLDAIPWAPSCPHGRPVAIAFDWPDIERRFDRR